MQDIDQKHFKCSLNLSSMVAEAASAEDARVMFRCPDCSMQKLERCAGPVECAAQKKPIVVMPKTKNSPEPPKRRGRKPKDSPSPEARAAVSAIDISAPAESREELARKALLELPPRPDPSAHEEIVRTFHVEITAARKAGCGWERISKTLRRFGYEIGEYALQKNFEKLNQA